MSSIRLSTTLTSFFSVCLADAFARTLLYAVMPRYYTWYASSKSFQRRKQGTQLEEYPNVFVSDALGRIYTVRPNNDECCYLRLVLVNVRGPTSFQQLITVKGICVWLTSVVAYLWLLENDFHWDNTLKDSVIFFITASNSQIVCYYHIQMLPFESELFIGQI